MVRGGYTNPEKSGIEPNWLVLKQSQRALDNDRIAYAHVGAYHLYPAEGLPFHAYLRGNGLE